MLKPAKWEDLRAEIENIIRKNNIVPPDFKALDIHDDWDKIEEKIYHTFFNFYTTTCVDNSSKRNLNQTKNPPWWRVLKNGDEIVPGTGIVTC